MAFNEDSSVSGHDEPWIQWFCGLKGHEMFCEVERSYIEDGFNLYGLRACVSNFSDCLDLILDRIGPDDDSDDSHLTQSACTLYGLIHARYIITAHGLDSMYSKYAAKEFGTCPLVQCAGQPVLPVSLKDEMGADTVKIYCAKCSQVYHPPPVRSRTGTSSGVDGAAFGTTFPHLFLMTFANLVPDPLPVESTYIPRVFGFRVHKSARQRFNAPAPTAVVLPVAIKSDEATNRNSEEDKKGSDDDESKSPPPVEANNNGVSPPIASADAASAAANGAMDTAGVANPSTPAAAAPQADGTTGTAEVGTPSTPATAVAAQADGVMGTSGVGTPTASAAAEAQADGATNNDGLGTPSAPPAAAAAAAQPEVAASEEKRSRSGAKRSRKETAPPAAEAKKETNGSAVPTFLMENAAKRRRRTANSTTSNNT